MTRERFNGIWEELRVLPVALRMSMVRALVHELCLDERTSMVDAGMFDPVAGEEFYLVAATGPRADVLRMAVAGLRRSAADGECRTLWMGDAGAATPLGGPGGHHGHD